jgi:hypothetical protein
MKTTMKLMESRPRTQYCLEENGIKVCNQILQLIENQC